MVDNPLTPNDPHILQLLRLEIAMFGTGAAATMLDEFIGTAERDAYLLRMYVCGEISGSCTFIGGRAQVEARSLTPLGMAKLEEYAARFDANLSPSDTLRKRPRPT